MSARPHDPRPLLTRPDEGAPEADGPPRRRLLLTRPTGLRDEAASARSERAEPGAGYAGLQQQPEESGASDVAALAAEVTALRAALAANQKRLARLEQFFGELLTTQPPASTGAGHRLPRGVTGRRPRPGRPQWIVYAAILVLLAAVAAEAAWWVRVFTPRRDSGPNVRMVTPAGHPRAGNRSRRR